MTLEDAARVAEIQVRSWQTAYRGIVPDTYLDAMNPEDRAVKWREILQAADSELLVIEEAGRILGWASWGDCRDDDMDPRKTAELWAIYLCPSAYGRGYGWQLWQEVERRVLEEGREEMTLWVLERNERARRFYGKAGFVPEPGARKVLERLGGIAELRYRREWEPGRSPAALRLS